jgi:ABC transporter DrrB family efflux protein
MSRIVTDGWVITQRNLIKIKRVPEVLVWVLMSPIMFVLLFGFVFGGAVDAGGDLNYREFLLAGIFAQTVVFGATFSGASLAEDMTKGIIDRFKSLPMSRSAVLIGRTAADIVYNVLSLIVMALTGLVVGWRAHEGVLPMLIGFGLLLLFGYAISWIMAYVGLIVPSVDVVNNASFMVIMPLTFVSNAFVPLESFYGIQRDGVEWKPGSGRTQAARELFGNIPSGMSAPEVWSMQHPALYTLLWVALIMVVFVPLSVRQYARATPK